jgi:hypothetical protein
MTPRIAAVTATVYAIMMATLQVDWSQETCATAASSMAVIGSAST